MVRPRIQVLETLVTPKGHPVEIATYVAISWVSRLILALLTVDTINRLSCFAL
jgi:hypothetical protein